MVQVEQSTTALGKNDLATYSIDIIKLKSLSDEEKPWLIRNLCKPDTGYTFPQQLEYGKNCAFQHSWLNVKHGPRQIESTGSNAHSLWDGDRL